MTVSSSLNKIIYTGDGTTKTFSVPFYVIAEEDIEIILVEISTQNETIVTSNYEIAPTGGSFPADTATVTYPLNDETPVTSDYNIVLYRYLDYVQETVYPNNTSLKPKVLERSLDKLTMQVQQLSEEVGRAVTVGVASTTTPTELMAELTTYVSDAGASATSSAEFADASSASATSASGYASDALQSVSDAQDIIDTIDFASEAEATAGTLETKVMSPSTTKASILANAPDTPIATATTAGKVIVGDNISVTEAGTISVTFPTIQTISVTTGTLTGGDAIPLPSGYTRAQCKYTVTATYNGLSATVISGMTEVSVGGSQIQVNLSVDSSTGVVVCRYRTYADTWSNWSNVTAGYMCVAIK